MITPSTSSTDASPRILVTDGRHTASAPASSMVPAEVKLKHLLVPVDFSPNSQDALNYALTLARQFGSQLTIVHVTEPVIYPNDWVYPLEVRDLAEERKFLLQKLEALAANQGPKIHVQVRSGRPWREIVNLADECKPDLIVIATHGYTGVKHALLGSVAEKVVRHAPCAVLTIRPEQAEE